MNFSKILGLNKKGFYKAIKENHLFIELISEDNNELPTIESYPLSIFEISRRNFNGKNLYYARCSKEFLGLLKKIEHILEEISDDPHLTEFEGISLSSFIKHLITLFYSKLAQYDFSEEVKADLSLVLTFEYMKISRILPLLLDPHVQEFYIDSPIAPVYLDHDQWGRCLTNLQFTSEEVQALTTHMQTFSGYALDYSVNSLKNDWQFKEYICRMSLDIYPLSASGFTLDVRKISSKVHTMPELVNSGTLSKEIVLYLLFFLTFGRNVTIIGEANSGKTTLLNALDLLLSPEKRRIYVEDVTESIDLLRYNYHQAKYRVSPYDTSQKRGSKSTEVTKILHRSPNIIILGEIQTKEHSKALFNSLSSGIRGMQTFHATSVEQAFRRWVFSHSIDPISLNELDLFVQMNRTFTFPVRRYLVSMSEILPSNNLKMSCERGDVSFNEIFVRDPNGEMVCLCPIERTFTFKKLCAIYPEIFLKTFFGKICKLFIPILDVDTDFESVISKVSDAWCKLNESISV